MNAWMPEALTARLAEFVVPQTGRPLGGPGTAFDIQSRDRDITVELALGFPAERSKAALLRRLEAHCEGVETPQPLRFTMHWSVEAHAVQKGLKPLPGVGNLIAVASGKGGVGKSTVAVNMALALALEGASVGLLDADIYGPSQPKMLGLTGQRPQTRDGQTLEPLVAHGVRAMSIGFLVDEQQPMAWRGPMVTSALNQLLTQTRWGELDYLLIDMPPGTGDIQLTLAQRVPVSGAVIVTTPQDVALSDARKGLEMFQKVGVPVLGIVENMSRHICTHCGHEEAVFGTGGGRALSEEYQAPLLGTLPLVASIGSDTDRGLPSVVAEPEGQIAASYFELAGRAAGELAVLAKDYSRLFPDITVEESS